ncbi:MAG: hypothetical protein ACREAU_00450 [Nitrosopumilaceae archaeon]
MKVDELFEQQLESTLLEMANLDVVDTGIDNVIIWVGADPHQHYLRVKVSNVPDKWSADNFTITIPELVPVGKINKQFITGQVLENIKAWIKFNLEIIKAHEEGKIGTRDFLTKIKKI